jgi:Arm DNA-binding domain
MTKQRNRLTARTVATTTEIGRYADGQNLYLKVSKSGSTLSKRWIFFYTIAGRQREAGLGSAATVTLAKAREKADGCRSLLAKGIGSPGCQAGRQCRRRGPANIRPVLRCTHKIEEIRMAQRRACAPMGIHARRLLRADPQSTC